MKNNRLANYALPFMLLIALYLAANIFRPLLPIDETRYMTVAWEMHLRGDWLAPLTVNFQPYHHKPPLLFWLINTAWSVFGVSRWAGMIPIALSALTCVLLTKKLAEKLFPENTVLGANIPFLMIGSIPFLIYSMLVMFDITLTVFVLASLLALVNYAQTQHKKYILWLGLAMGLGVLTKGPVAWLYLLFPILFGPLWMPAPMVKVKWYIGCLLAFILSILPVLAWLIPVLSHSSDKFAYWLVWEQTAGRVTGNFSASHARPVWFYLPLVPVLFLPWVFFPSFWGGLKNIRQHFKDSWSVRLILLWIVPVFIAFSLISGKQPHYMVPLLPGVIILISIWIKASSLRLRVVATSIVAFLILGLAVASYTFFPKYDLKPMTDYLQAHKDNDWAYVRKYHGELTFLGRLEKPIYQARYDTIDQWLEEHPNGLAIIRYTHKEHIEKYDILFDMEYRGRHTGVFKRKS